MWLPVLCAFATSAAAQQNLARQDAKTLLLAVRKKVMLTVGRLPRYMCTETVDRSVFQPGINVSGRSCDDLASRRKKTDWKIRKYTSDRLRLDVAVSGDSEMYSWAGEDRFEDRSLADLAGGGATSTGAFASFLAAIFGSNAASFTYNGDVNSDGRALVEFGFRMPLEKSGYSIGNKLHRAIVAYDGMFLVDPWSFDLARLTIHADQLPVELNACEDTTILDYGSVRLNGSEFLLPKQVRLHVVNTDGGELENRTVFTGCHEFLGESSLRFDAPSETGIPAARKTGFTVLELPEGLPFTFALTRAIDSVTAAAGDPIQGQLTKPIKEKHGGILVPKGATVTGRIVQIERLYARPSQSLTLAIRLETIEANGAPEPFHATLESAVKRHAKPAGGLVERQDLGSFDEMFDADDASVGVLEFQDVTKDYVIHRGVEVEGLTAGSK